MGKRKTIHVDLKKNDKVLFSTPISSPDVVLGLMSTLAVPQNYDCTVSVYVKDVEETTIINEKEDN